MKAALTWAMLGALAQPAAADVAKEDLKKLAAAGIGDDVVPAFIQAKAPVSRMSADALAELKQAGVSDGVLMALIETAAPARVVARTGVVTQETYVYPVEYSYAPCYASASTYSSWYAPSFSLSLGYYRISSGSWCRTPGSYDRACPPSGGSSNPADVRPPGGRPGLGGTPPGQGGGSTRPGHIGNPGHGGVKPRAPAIRAAAATTRAVASACPSSGLADLRRQRGKGTYIATPSPTGTAGGRMRGRACPGFRWISEGASAGSPAPSPGRVGSSRP